MIEKIVKTAIAVIYLIACAAVNIGLALVIAWGIMKVTGIL